MTDKEIKSVVTAKIEGQGTNVDGSSVLPGIVNSLVDNKCNRGEIYDFEEFDTTTAYSSGDIVTYEGSIYKFTASKDAGEWDATKVTRTNIVAILREEIQG